MKVKKKNTQSIHFLYLERLKVKKSTQSIFGKAESEKKPTQSICRKAESGKKPTQSIFGKAGSGKKTPSLYLERLEME